jgi:hypothetical protein
VEDIINSPPQQDPYTTLKTELVKGVCPSRDHQRTHQLFTLEKMGDRKPSQFLRHLKSLAQDIPDKYLSIVGHVGGSHTTIQGGTKCIGVT